ncbi:MAG: transglutaminase-like domain-containing protein [Caldimicrobium thiodismutans]
MKRREFLKITGLSFFFSNLRWKQVLAEKLIYKEVELIYKANFPFEDKKVRLWVPLPMNTSFQHLNTLEIKGSFSSSQITHEKIYETPIFYAEFGRGAPKYLELKMKIALFGRKPVNFSKLPPNNKAIPEEVKIFLRPTQHIPIDGVVKETARRIIQGKRTDLEKVKAIYNWVVENTYRDPRVKGCGVGDAGKALESGTLGGKCTDISSIFVALCRAAGIPAREIFGLRVLPSELALSISNVKGDATMAQHCKAEFWLNGWIPADPADVRKFMLEEKIQKVDDPRVKRIKEFLFGGWDNHWVMFNYARDFVLEPPPTTHEPINEFMYPQAEVDGKLLDKLEVTFEYSKYEVKTLN